MIEHESDYKFSIEGVELKVKVRFRNKYDVDMIRGILNHISRKEDWEVTFGEGDKK